MLEFEWDPTKEGSNQVKHGISFTDASTAFADAMSLTIFDPDRSDDEDRYIFLGIAGSGRLLVVVHTDRNDIIRLISARRANRQETLLYEAKH